MPGMAALSLWASTPVFAQQVGASPGAIVLRVAGRPGDLPVASANLVAKYLSRQLGGVNIRVEVRTTASALDVLNDFAAAAPRDGSALLLAPPITAQMQALAVPGAAYDAGAFNWIGALSHAPMTLAASWVTGFRTLEDGARREMEVGAVGDMNEGAWYPAVLNALFRTRFKVATNYRSSREIDAAIDSGEIGGRLASWAEFNFGQSPLFQQGKLNFLMQIGPVGLSELGRTPLLGDIVKAPGDRDIASFISSDAAHGRSLAAPPGTPVEIVERYRKAFAAMTSDPAFIAEAHDLHIETSGVDGAAVAHLVAAELAAPADAVRRSRQAIVNGAQ